LETYVDETKQLIVHACIFLKEQQFIPPLKRKKKHVLVQIKMRTVFLNIKNKKKFIYKIFKSWYCSLEPFEQNHFSFT